MPSIAANPVNDRLRPGDGRVGDGLPERRSGTRLHIDEIDRKP